MSLSYLYLSKQLLTTTLPTQLGESLSLMVPFLNIEGGMIRLE